MSESLGSLFGGTSDGSESEANTPSAADERILDAMRGEANRVFMEHSFLTDHLSLGQLNFFVAGWKNRRGVVRHNKTPQRRVFGNRINGDDFRRVTGQYSIGLARRVYEEDNNWEGTVRHEVAHAYLHAKHGEAMGHGNQFKELNDRLGGSYKESGERENYDYALSCPEGCFTRGYHRRSKKIQKPWKRRCKHCKSACVSHDYEAAVPSESGVCKVESIDWGNRMEYFEHPTQSLGESSNTIEWRET